MNNFPHTMLDQVNRQRFYVPRGTADVICEVGFVLGVVTLVGVWFHP